MPSPALSASSGNDEKSIASLKKDIERRTEIIKNHENDLMYLKRERQNYDQSIKLLDMKLSITENKIKLVSSQIIELENQISDLETLNDSNIQMLKNMVRQLYMFGENPGIKIILGNDNVSEYDRYMTYYQILAEQRKEIISNIAKNQTELRNSKQYLERKKTELSELRTEYDRNLGSLNKERTQRKFMEDALQSNINNEKQQLRKQEDALKELEKAIETKKLELAKKRKQAELKAIADAKAKAKKEGRDTEKAAREEKESFAKRNNLNGLGKNLPWPVKGSVIKKFGQVRFTSTKWTGLLIACNEGNSVSSISAGDVLYSGWMNGWGNIIVIDHGADYLSIYANNKANLVRSGQRVQRGDVIATAGNSGGLETNSLYFEIRKNSVPLNPRNFLK
ncbi:peptidoglycan DD-metalloendopeptidase family protein [uncultured Ruminobacter sp.]|uniref:murein hydrolase activator EnvC family protein n=1 Tax=uncultured Ruminobacter sp. TaxID=538947 RepID=UPI00262E280F|nr:peptidoglycan DD-metalloendopeptidase family protein [uncultured Ruminobacter sp.]